MTNVDVTVIIGAYNSMPYVTTSVTSVLEQTIGPDRFELIAVNDGSTDGTGEELDRLADTSSAMQVIHQANSGGPAGPRNTGIELARGRYLLFLDADDFLGPEALERMVDVADRAGSDVVLGRMAGAGGRKPPKSMFKENLDRANLFTSRVWWTLSAQKLFRKSLIDRLGLRFPDLKIGQDQPFTGMAYLNAQAISVIADYDCYFIVARDDGENNTQRQRDPRDRIQSVEVMMRMVADHIPPGKDRDALMKRHFHYDLRDETLGARFVDADPAAQSETVDRARVLVDKYWTENLSAAAPVDTRVRFMLISRGETSALADLVRTGDPARNGRYLTRAGRVYEPHPLLDSPLGLPNECFDVTDKLPVRHRLTGIAWEGDAFRVAGWAYIARVDTVDTASRVLLRERNSGTEYLLPTELIPTPGLTDRESDTGYQYDSAGFTVKVNPFNAADGEPLPPGLWDFFVLVQHQGIARTVRLGEKRPEEITCDSMDREITKSDGSTVRVKPYFTKLHSNLTLDVGGIRQLARQAAEERQRKTGKRKPLVHRVYARITREARRWWPQ